MKLLFSNIFTKNCETFVLKSYMTADLDTSLSAWSCMRRLEKSFFAKRI